MKKLFPSIGKPSTSVNSVILPKTLSTPVLPPLRITAESGTDTPRRLPVTTLPEKARVKIVDAGKKGNVRYTLIFCPASK